jgi:hypothetical protein
LNKQQVETSNKGVFANKIISVTSTKESSRFLLAHPHCHCTAANVSTSAVYSGGDSNGETHSGTPPFRLFLSATCSIRRTKHFDQSVLKSAWEKQEKGLINTTAETEHIPILLSLLNHAK